mmetsp:Transcript_28929/g.70422  ORF Transcript_28929/g.70422 Transcript_28929/m.70422 type:complete len:252 (-) Transcript_28929:648-1403(-)
MVKTESVRFWHSAKNEVHPSSGCDAYSAGTGSMATGKEGSLITFASSSECSLPMRGACVLSTWPSASPTSRRGSAPLKEGCHHARQMGRPGICMTGSRWTDDSSIRQKTLPSSHAAAQYLEDPSKQILEIGCLERRCRHTSVRPSALRTNKRSTPSWLPTAATEHALQVARLLSGASPAISICAESRRVLESKQRRVRSAWIVRSSSRPVSLDHSLADATAPSLKPMPIGRTWSTLDSWERGTASVGTCLP